jgi:DAK2 domain fusion protein YloV
MEALEALGRDDLRSAMVAYRDALRTHQERLNRLNVYPVPDGDTGTNMALTLESVVAELDGLGLDAAADVRKAIRHGSLMGARGNSGVILSQILRGLCDGLGDGDPAGPRAVAGALAAASRAADQAVMKPVEGTILTVARRAAEAAQAAGDADLVPMLEAASQAATVALDETPKLLPLLADAGVVDAGGAGFVLLLDAFLHVADGRPLPEADHSPAAAGVSPAREDADRPHRRESDDGGRYEVMFFLDVDDDRVDGFKQAWSAIGDSVVVVGGEGLWNCHVHTDDIGASIEAALAAGGRPHDIRVTDLDQQVAEEAAARAGGEAPEAPGVREKVATAVVAVGAGEGIVRVFRELGAQEVVAGGQTLNPSTAQLLAAVEATSADSVIVLPNNNNVVPVARQVPELSTRTVRVLPTRGVVEGLAALVAYDPKADLEANERAMGRAAAEVVWGEVTRAVRDAAATPVGPVGRGDYLGLAADDIVVCAPDAAAAACALLDRLVEDHHELVTVIEGEGADGADTERVRAWLEANRPGAAVEVQSWGQPRSAYLFSIE